jgi:choline transport protein
MDRVFLFGLNNGGPAGLVYQFLFCWAGYAAVVASMAELVSMFAYCPIYELPYR